MNWLSRDAPPRAVWALAQHGLHPLMARLYAARGVYEAQDTDASLAHLLPPEGLMGVTEAAALLADAMAQQRRICIVADYDCDGATACAIGIRALRALLVTRLARTLFRSSCRTFGCVRKKSKPLQANHLSRPIHSHRG